MRGQNEMELGRFGPQPQEKLPCKTFRLMGTRVPSLLRKQNDEVAVQGIIMHQNGLKLCRIGYFAQQKHLDFWPLRGYIYFLSKILRCLSVHGIIRGHNKIKNGRNGPLRYPIAREKGAGLRNSARAVSRLSAQSSNKRVPITQC